VGTDGTDAGTHPVNTVVSPAVALFNFPYLTNLDGTIYFAGANATERFEPWKSDGSAGGTSMIANIAPRFSAVVGSAQHHRRRRPGLLRGVGWNRALHNKRGTEAVNLAH